MEKVTEASSQIVDVRDQECKDNNYLRAVIFILANYQPFYEYFTSERFQNYLRAGLQHCATSKIATELKRFKEVTKDVFKEIDIQGIEKEICEAYSVFKPIARVQIVEYAFLNLIRLLEFEIRGNQIPVTIDIDDRLTSLFRKHIKLIVSVHYSYENCKHEYDIIRAISFLAFNMENDGFWIVEHCIEESYLRPYKVEETCTKCHIKGDATRTITILRLPPLLVISFNNEITGKRFKRAIDFPLVLDMKPYVSNAGEVNTKFEPFGVITYHGSSEKGFYTSALHKGDFKFDEVSGHVELDEGAQYMRLGKGENRQESMIFFIATTRPITPETSMRRSQSIFMPPLDDPELPPNTDEDPLPPNPSTQASSRKSGSQNRETSGESSGTRNQGGQNSSLDPAAPQEGAYRVTRHNVNAGLAHLLPVQPPKELKDDEVYTPAIRADSQLLGTFKDGKKYCRLINGWFTCSEGDYRSRNAHDLAYHVSTMHLYKPLDIDTLLQIYSQKCIVVIEGVNHYKYPLSEGTVVCNGGLNKFISETKKKLKYFDAGKTKRGKKAKPDKKAILALYEEIKDVNVFQKLADMFNKKNKPELLEEVQETMAQLEVLQL